MVPTPEGGLVLDVRRMLLLLEVARHGSVTGAARALSYTPSAVSQQIARLEAEAGQALLERHPRGITLTAAGEVVVARGRSIARQLDAAQQELSDLAELRAGRLRIGGLLVRVTGPVRFHEEACR